MVAHQQLIPRQVLDTSDLLLNVQNGLHLIFCPEFHDGRLTGNMAVLPFPYMFLKQQ